MKITGSVKPGQNVKVAFAFEDKDGKAKLSGAVDAVWWGRKRFTQALRTGRAA